MSKPAPSTSVADTCRTCCRPVFDPFRRTDKDGKIVEGCVAKDHNGHLHGASLAWHNRPASKRCRDLVKLPAPDPDVELWVSPNGVEHTIVRGKCATCGQFHEPGERSTL